MRAPNKLAWTVAHALVALFLGTGAAFVVHERLDSPPDYLTNPGDRVLAAVQGVENDHVHVTDDGREMLDEEGEAAIAAVIDERDLPVHVVVWQDSWFAGYDHYIQAAEQVLAQLDEPGVLVLWQGPSRSTTVVSQGYRMGRDAQDGSRVIGEPEYLGNASLRLTEWLGQLPDEPIEKDDWDYYGGRVGGFFIGLLYGLPIVGGVWLMIGIVRLRTGRSFRNVPART